MNNRKNNEINNKKENNIIKNSKYSIKEFLKNYKMYILCIVILILSIISIVVQAIDRKNTMQVNSTTIKGKDEKIAVYITGAVKNPGVYYLEENSRLITLLDICGGISENADIEQINLAKKLVDSDKINIPIKQEKSNTNDEIYENDNIEQNSDDNSIKENSDKSEKININNASKEELMELTGIGESTANKIIEYRKSQRFLEIEDIMNVSGIGKSKFDKIKDDIVVD